MKVYTALKQKALWGGLALTLMLTGCAEYEVRQLEGTKPQGSTFTTELKKDYQAFAASETREMYDEFDGYYFATKGELAAEGKAIMPEHVERWNLAADRIPELSKARSWLIHSFDRGARTVAPQEAARAQVMYDCWVEETEEGWQGQNIGFCRDEFHKAMTLVEEKLGGPKVIKEGRGNVLQAPPAFVVLFDNKSYNLDAEAMKIIKQASKKDPTQPGYKILLLGRTDREGGDSYNKGLSMKRAEAVKAALIKLGMPAKHISVRAMGETPGKMVEPDNRRVDILWDDGTWVHTGHEKHKGHHHQGMKHDMHKHHHHMHKHEAVKGAHHHGHHHQGHHHHGKKHHGMTPGGTQQQK